MIQNGVLKASGISQFFLQTIATQLDPWFAFFSPCFGFQPAVGWSPTGQWGPTRNFSPASKSPNMRKKGQVGTGARAARGRPRPGPRRAAHSAADAPDPVVLPDCGDGWSEGSGRGVQPLGHGYSPCCRGRTPRQGVLPGRALVPRQVAQRQRRLETPGKPCFWAPLHAGRGEGDNVCLAAGDLPPPRVGGGHPAPFFRPSSVFAP